MDPQHCHLETNRHVCSNLVYTQTRWEWKQKCTLSFFVFLPFSSVSHFLRLSFCLLFTHGYPHTVSLTRMHKQMIDLPPLSGFYNNCFGILANSLCLPSLSMGYVIVYFHWECLLARTLISKRLSSHTKEVLEINWRWSLQKLVSQ